MNKNRENIEDVEMYYKALNIDIETKHYISEREIKYTDKIRNVERIITTWTPSNASIKDMMGNPRTYKNRFYIVNEGRTKTETYEKNFRKYEKEVECRCNEDIKKYNAIFFDFDMKQFDGVQYPDIHLTYLENRKEILFHKIMSRCPILPTWVINSRNGYHVYFALKDEDRNISLKQWTKLEKEIYQYMFDNVSQCVDSKATNAGRILRVVNSYHKKKGSKPYLITSKYFSGLQYTLKELMLAFDVDIEEKQKPAKAKKKQEKYTDTPDYAVINKRENLKAIQNLNADYFANYPKQDAKMSFRDAVKFLRSINLIDFLGLPLKEREGFCSILRNDDDNPSCRIYANDDDEWIYYDYGRGAYDIMDCVGILSNTTYYHAMKFLCTIYGISVEYDYTRRITKEEKQINEVYQNNVEIYDTIAENKEYKFLRKMKPTYHAVMDIWQREHANRKDIPLSKLQIMAGCEYIATQYGMKKSNVAKYLMILSYLGILQRTGNLKTKDGKIHYMYKVNELMQWCGIVIENIEKLQNKVENVFRDVTEKKLLDANLFHFN